MWYQHSWTVIFICKHPCFLNGIVTSVAKGTTVCGYINILKDGMCFVQ